MLTLCVLVLWRHQVIAQTNVDLSSNVFTWGPINLNSKHVFEDYTFGIAATFSKGPPMRLSRPLT